MASPSLSSTPSEKRQPNGEARRLILVKHALPALDARLPAREWRLAVEGERQARCLAQRLHEAAPFALASSREPKADRTAQIVGEELGSSHQVRAGLEEFDRPVLPLLSKADHVALNAAIFAEPSRRVLGRESAEEALLRFRGAVAAAVADAAPAESVVAVTHGTVISLLVAAHDRVDGFALWKRLAWPGLDVLEVIDRVD